MQNIHQPLSNVQLEILKAFSYSLNTDDLREFKDFIAQYFAKKAIDSADLVWEENKWTDSDVDILLKTKMRKQRK